MKRRAATLVTVTLLVLISASGLSAGRSIGPLNPGSRAAYVGDHGNQISANWAGYAATGATFTDVTGSWTQPTASCSGKQQLAAIWVGIDGFLSGDNGIVEQIGTDSDCKPGKKGGPSYYAWFDMFPAPLHSFSRQACPVAAGDAMSAEVSSSGSQFALHITDATRGWTCAAPLQSAQTPGTSAEWVVEDPSSTSSGRLLKLTNFGTVTFSGATANGSPISALAHSTITMQVKRQVKAATTPLFPDGASFSVTWQHS